MFSTLIKWSFGAAALLLTASAFAGETSSQSARVQTFDSPNGNQEKCIALASIPGGKYLSKDAEQESYFCSLNIYDAKTAICPKTVSTSPGSYIFSTGDSKLSASQFEASKCSASKSSMKASGIEKLAKFKNTMNATGTSGTFSPASLLYYHFSRYLIRTSKYQFRSTELLINKFTMTESRRRPKAAKAR